MEDYSNDKLLKGIALGVPISVVMWVFIILAIRHFA